MSSFIYLYSKFTEELLLLSSAALFTLMAIYCYEWVIKKRRLGAARDQIPANMVKIYLNQLIQEAQGVRTQLFGLMNEASQQPMIPVEKINSADSILSALGNPQVSPDLEARLKALQTQLTEKESIVVNINVEKTKLLEEIENLRQNQKVSGGAGASGPSEDLLRKVKELEARLEEYSLFEDDLANLKRLQQENLQLKKRLDDLGTGLPPREPEIRPVREAAPAPQAPVAPVSENIEFASKAPVSTVDQQAIDALLEGLPATPPEKPAPAEPQVEPVKTVDAFENLSASVDTSLGSSTPTPAVSEPAATEPPTPETLAAKTDEELLKEFENLLNS